MLAGHWGTRETMDTHRRLRIRQYLSRLVPLLLQLRGERNLGSSETQVLDI